MNRPTFVLAAIGSAIGLGNFWRFPYLTYKYGGAFFFFPYIICLLFMGIPLLLMELSLGQKFQRGDVSVFRGIHPRLAGIGMVSVLSAYIITWYYNVIISWAVVYLIASFRDPLPWSEFNEDFVASCNVTDTTRAEEFFYKDVVRYYDDDCVKYTDGAQVSFSVYAFLAVLFVWVVCFFAIFKGVKSSSYVVWVTVPLPVFFIIIMVIKGATLDGARDGISQYLRGDTNKFDGLEGTALQEAKDAEAQVQKGVWSDAAGQIFFSIGVCMGIMTSYGSYNPIRKPIIMDNMIICFSNSLLSFVAGFAVWQVVGYLQATDSLAQGSTSSIGLAFIAYPTAIDLMMAPNLWAIMLSITLFTLGVDSAFSMVEATATVICDTKWGKQFPRAFIAFLLCLLGFVLSIPFCTNWGFFLLDVVDHYLANYLLILVGILQCAGCGWGFDVERTHAKSPFHEKSLQYLTRSFWLIVILFGIIFPSVKQIPLGLILAVVCVFLFSLLPSFFISKMKFSEWYNDIAMCGVRRIGYAMTMLGRKDPNVQGLWEPFFVFYWGVCIKYLIPLVLWFIMINTCINAKESPYGGYSTGWQVVGMLIPITGVVLFLAATVIGVHEEPFDKEQFEELGEGQSGSSALTKIVHEDLKKVSPTQEKSDDEIPIELAVQKDAEDNAVGIVGLVQKPPVINSYNEQSPFDNPNPVGSSANTVNIVKNDEGVS